MINHNPYSNNQNSMFNQQIHDQRRLQNERLKQEYKSACEQSFDNVVADYKDAQKNNIDLNINEAYKSAIVRYFKRYWDKQFMLMSLVLLFIVIILSFYTKYALIGILAVFVMKIIYSQSNFTRYFLNDHDVSNDEIREIENIIFGNQLSIIKMFLFAITLSFMSFVISFYSVNIYIDLNEHEKLLVFLSKFAEFKPSNELFAYSNVASMFVLIVLKTIEKWKK